LLAVSQHESRSSCFT